MVMVPASLAQAVAPAAGVTTNVPVIPLAAALSVPEICTVLLAPDADAELSVKFNVFPIT